MGGAGLIDQTGLVSDNSCKQDDKHLQDFDSDNGSHGNFPFLSSMI